MLASAFALYSTDGTPVAAVGITNGVNAAQLWAQILALRDVSGLLNSPITHVRCWKPLKS